MTSSSNVTSSDAFGACEDLAANVDEGGVVALATRTAEAAAAGERGNLTAAIKRAPLIFPDECTCDDVALLASDRCGSLGRGCGGGLDRSAHGPCDCGWLRPCCGCTTTCFNAVARLGFAVGCGARFLFDGGASTSDEPWEMRADCGERDASRDTRLLVS